MSASFFDTILAVDLATAPDGMAVLAARPGTGSPRWTDGSRSARSWATCHPNAEMVVRIAAEAVREQEMNGISADMPARREFAAQLLDAAADLVRDLALDADCDGELTDTDWEARLAGIATLIDGGAYPPEGMRTRRGSVRVFA